MNRGVIVKRVLEGDVPENDQMVTNLVIEDVGKNLGLRHKAGQSSHSFHLFSTSDNNLKTRALFPCLLKRTW